MTLPTPRTKEETLFLSHVREVPPPAGKNLTSPCWEWTASCAGDGRPQFNQHIDKKQKNTPAARWAFNTFKRPLLPKEQACHLCDNELCVSPDHLYAGSVRENMLDKLAQGRQSNSDVLTQLNKALTLSSQGMSPEDIAQNLKYPLWAIERLLDFHENYAPYHTAYMQMYGQAVADQLQRHRLIEDYGGIISAQELLSLTRHIRQLDLCL